MDVRDKLYIGGAWVPSTGSETIDVVNATTEEVIGRIPQGSPEDVDKAVAAAKEGFAEWSETSVDDRSKYLQRIAEGLQARMEPLAQLITTEMGMPVRLSQMIQVGLPMTTFMSMSQVLQEIPFEEQIGNSKVIREPVGVVGCITPWNYPLHQIAAKVAPALAAGCTVVLKPSEVAPLSAFILAEIIDSVRLPRGVFNLVSGDGQTVGEAISGHADVDM